MDNLNLKLFTMELLYITNDFIPDAQPPLQYPKHCLNKPLISSEILLHVKAYLERFHPRIILSFKKKLQ